ncbi:inner centromere protein isoform 1-T2 [Cochliomyia hominivorax]
MEDLNKIQELAEKYPQELEQMSEEFLLKLRVCLFGEAAIVAANKENLKDLPASSPQQTKKRVKRLTSLTEDNEPEDNGKTSISPRRSKRSNAELLATAEVIANSNGELEIPRPPVAAPRTNTSNIQDHNEVDIQDYNEVDSTRENQRKSDSIHLMPPPPAPKASVADETLNKRPQRAAKLKSEKNLKEPKLKTKLRRPSNDEIKIKLEHEQRPSQMHETATINQDPSETLGTNSTVSSKETSIITATDITRQSIKTQKNSIDNLVRDIRIKIKREKISFPSQEEQPHETPSETLVLPVTTTNLEETSLASTILSSTTNNTSVAPTKKIRKKKDVVHRPIKVERFSDLDSKSSPISSRTRQSSMSKTDIGTSPVKKASRPASIYEDAVENPLSQNSKDNINATVNIGGVGIVNETVNLGPTPSDATFCTNPTQTTFQVAPAQSTFIMDSNPNATVTLNKVSADVTFNVHQISKEKDKDKAEETLGQRSFETAKDSSIPNDHADSPLTDDECVKPSQTKSNKVSGKTVYKMPTRTNELFNPLVQSPVKMRVEAFENAAAAATDQSKRPLRIKKENVTPTSSSTTPVIGKLPAPALGRFLTPTQSSNIGMSNSAIAKKGTTSASKALPMPKSSNASSLQRSNSTTSTKTLQRENSGDDFRKGLHVLAEERKKQREQKHLLAAQQREAKERERAERMAKLAKEREEKRLLKKQQEQEQKKRELEEIQRKLRQQQEEDAAKLKAAKEREMLLQMKQQQQLAKQKMMPPPPRAASKYTFEMLHEDDSTDDENKVSYKRPPPPSWSRSHIRGPYMLKQEYTPSAYIDSFFSVQPMTPDLKIIFPNIDARHLKRNSSVFWSTPPRYSELPKY